jgi:arabinofuranosyltransferase
MLASPTSSTWWIALLILAAMALFVYSSLTYDFTQDDAYISFRYAANFLDGKGLVFNAGERVEGYTNFLWVMLMALFRGLFGINYLLTSRFFGVLSGAFIFYLLYLLLRSHFRQLSWLLYTALAVMLLSNQSLAYWSISSLETSAFACMALAALVAEYRKPQLTPALLAIATLLRPEGAVVFGAILFDRIIIERKFPISFFLMYFVPLLPFAVFKLAYYGSLFPNPYYAKSGVGLEYIASGLEYTWYFIRTTGVYGVILAVPLTALALIKGHWMQYRLLYLYVFLYTAYIIWVGGDVLKVYRFFVPVVPVLCFLFVVSAVELLAMVRQKQQAFALTLLVAGSFSVGSYLLARDHVKVYWAAEQQITRKMHFMSTMLKKYMGNNFSLAASTIGMVGYQLLGHRIIDMLGLTDASIARNPETIPGMTSSWKERRFNSRYLLEQQPDFILFSTGYKPSAPAERALMLHSEFRRSYRTTGFLRDQAYKIVWQRWRDIDMSRDRALPDMEFINKLAEGYNLQARSAMQPALDAFNDAYRRLGENFPALYFAMGHCLIGLNQNDSAAACFRKAIAADSLCWEAYWKLAILAEQQKDTAAFNRYQVFLIQHTPWIFDGSYIPPGGTPAASPSLSD